MTAPRPISLPFPAQVRHRPRDWALAVGGALALHAGWLADASSVATWRRSESAVPTLAASAPVPAPVKVVRRVELVARPAGRVAAVEPAAPPVARPSPAATAAPAPAETRTAFKVASPAAARVPPAPLADLEPDGRRVPTYRTRLPPPFHRLYTLTRGEVVGRAELAFELDAEGYRLALRSQLPERAEQALLSRGGQDAHGLAPERFAEARRGRERLAAHFDRAGARITYSGPQARHALLPGAQDRLSWLVQLAAVVAADPGAWPPGAEIHLPVSGTRGDAGVWTFVVQGEAAPDPTAAPDWPVLHLVRAPERPYDTRAEVWLDPADHHLPRRVRLSHPPGGVGFELRRDDPGRQGPGSAGPGP